MGCVVVVVCCGRTKELTRQGLHDVIFNGHDISMLPLMNSSKFARNIAQAFQLSTRSLSTRPSISYFLPDRFFNFSRSELFNTQSCIIRRLVHRLEMAVTQLPKTSGVVGYQHSRHKLLWRKGCPVVQRCHRSCVSCLRVALFYSPSAIRSLLRDLKRSVLGYRAPMDFQAMICDTVRILQDRAHSSCNKWDIRVTDGAFSSIPQSRRPLGEIENDRMVKNKLQQSATVKHEPGDLIFFKAKYFCTATTDAIIGCA
jgi:hypothetical protein